MADVLRPALRTLVVLAVLAVAALEVRSLHATLGVLGQRRAQAGERVRQALLAARPSARALQENAGAAACLDEVRRWLPSVKRHDLELLGPDGRLLLAHPAGWRHTVVLSQVQLRTLGLGQVVTVGPVSGPDGPRLLSHVALAGPGSAIERVSSALPGTPGARRK